ncbi:hypothetical protein [Serratia odorifera]|uniref:hypothetical protein n=1 Tax=Serratia odorifera TaxID=618 RepID=UPI001F53F7EF|nr:hypothetical protein [Serratia odorifera]
MKLQLESSAITLPPVITACRRYSGLERQHADLVLTDCQMPTLSGYQLAQTQRERGARSAALPADRRLHRQCL